MGALGDKPQFSRVGGVKGTFYYFILASAMAYENSYLRNFICHLILGIALIICLMRYRIYPKNSDR